MNKTAIIIPSRLNAKRLPNKPLKLINKKERPGRNPKTGEDVTITARRVVTFRAGNKLRKKIANFDE